jgi:L-amino acid N-acyltransferase YncA
MAYKRQILLEDGTTVTIEQLTGKEDPKDFQQLINPIIKEGAFILRDKPVPIAEEKKWLAQRIDANRKGEEIYLKAIIDGKLIGCCNATQGRFMQRGNVDLGIMLDKRWRGKGIGKLLLEESIALSKKKWKPRNIYLMVVSENKEAVKLYTFLGFRVTAVLPGWINRKGRYYDLLIMTQKNLKRK